jgi:hypothetical protein
VQVISRLAAAGKAACPRPAASRGAGKQFGAPSSLPNYIGRAANSLQLANIASVTPAKPVSAIAAQDSPTTSSASEVERLRANVPI